MSDFSLYELKQNDELTDVVRKSNSNFKNLGYALKKKIQGSADSSSTEWKQAIADLTKDMTQQIADLTTDLTDTKEKLTTAEQQISDLTTDLTDTKEKLTAAEQTMAEMVPPLGATLIQNKNPETMYPGTTWVQYGSKHPLMWGNSTGANRKYYEPLDADGNSMLPASLKLSTAQTAYTYAYVTAWYRSA